MSVAGLILAAGESRRMGSPKALLEFQGETFLDRLIASFSAYCSPVVAVLGARAGDIRAGLRRASAACLAINPDWERGQMTSLQCGLRSVPEEAEGVLFTLVDHPNVRPSTLAALLAQPRATVAVPQYQGKHGHPVFFARELIAELLAASGDAPAKSVFGRHEVRYVAVDDPGIVQDIDRPEDYERLIS